MLRYGRLLFSLLLLLLKIQAQLLKCHRVVVAVVVNIGETSQLLIRLRRCFNYYVLVN